MEDSKKFNEVQNLKDILLKERDNIIEIIKNNNNIISSLQDELDSINENLDDDLKFFSPVIDDENEKKYIEIQKKLNEIIIDNDSQQEKLNLLIQNISALDSVQIKDCENENYLSQIIINLNEMDRKRIARELHDTTIQNLVCLIHKIELASKFIDMDPIRAKLELSTAMKYMKETIEEIRAMVYDLRPMSFDDLGFDVLLKQYLEELESMYENEVEYDIHADFDGIDEDYLLTLYRIIKECCINSIKHSKGAKLSLKITEEDHIFKILITDDGKGCDLNREIDKHHYGLKILKDRVALLNGNLKIVSEPDKGYSTEITFEKSKLTKK